MKLLKDDELAKAIFQPGPGVRALIDPVPSNRAFDTAESAIQPASLDLHLGEIFIPGADPDSSGEPVARKELSLKTGQTAVLTTKEKVQLPPNIAAFGFPPARISAAGLLVTNPGHVDPGYTGPLHLTVINMGRQEFLLYEGLAILTVLFVELSGYVASDWQKRYGPPTETSLRKDLLSRLSPDFLDIENRATKIAARVVGDAELTIKNADIEVKRLQNETALTQTRLQSRYGLITALIAAIITLIGLLVTTYFTSAKELDGLRNQVTELTKKLDDRARLENEVQQLRQQVKDLELKIGTGPKDGKK
jgi:dCTP deaminase